MAGLVFGAIGSALGPLIGDISFLGLTVILSAVADAEAAISSLNTLIKT